MKSLFRRGAYSQMVREERRRMGGVMPRARRIARIGLILWVGLAIIPVALAFIDEYSVPAMAGFTFEDP